MRMKPAVLAAVICAWMPLSHGQTKPPHLNELLSKQVKIDRAASVDEIPISERNGKIYLRAVIGELEEEFIFDTGSPTILDEKLAERLELEIIGENRGRDANGKAVSMKIAIVKSLQIGDTRFHNIPVMVHDFTRVPLAHCYIPNGVLGSELLPGSAWRLNLSDASLKIASSIDELPLLAQTESAALHQFGYPFAPIVDYSIGRFSDKALFDTGSSAEVALFQDVVRDKSVRKKIDRESVQNGTGRHGTSAAGVGDILPLQTFDLTELRIGDHEIGRTHTRARPIPPTLIGAGLLKSHIVTLDYPNARFLMSPNGLPRAHEAHAGFSASVIDNAVEVSQLFEGSDAQKAGLTLGDQIVEIDGYELPVTTDQDRCETSLWLSNNFDAAGSKELIVKRGDTFVEISF